MKKEIGCIIATYTMEALMGVAMGIVMLKRGVLTDSSFLSRRKQSVL